LSWRFAKLSWRFVKSIWGLKKSKQTFYYADFKQVEKIKMILL
jgi:hypothetical protein